MGREFPGSIVVRTQHFHYQGLGSVPGQGTKILQAMPQSKKLKRRQKNWINIFPKRKADGEQTHEKMLSITNHQGNTNENHSELTPHLSEWLSSKRTQRTHIGKDVEKRELSHTNDGNVNWCNHCGKQYGGSQKLKTELPYDLPIPLLGICLKKNKNNNLKWYMPPNVHSNIIYLMDT